MNSSPSPEEDPHKARALGRIGTTLLGKWHLHTLLGVGGMAAVYGATHHNGSHVAIKILHGDLVHLAEAKERFLEEAYAANRVQHPGAVPVLDDGVTDDGCAFLVMELLEGETLEARLQRAERSLSPLEVLTLTDGLLDVLAAAHHSGMVHRDVKPENVFLTNAGRIKLLDFGIARMRETRRTLRTQTGATMGTPAFMSPEQARGRWDELDGRSDLWSVGATMFVLLTGRLVHEADTINEQLLAAMTLPAPPLQSVAPLVPPELAQIVDRALAASPEHRFESAVAMQAAVRSAHARLCELALAEGRSSSPPVAGGPIEPALPVSASGHTTHRPVSSSAAPPRRQRAFLSLVLVAAAAVGAGVALFPAGGSSPGAAVPADLKRPADRPFPPDIQPEGLPRPSAASDVASSVPSQHRPTADAAPSAEPSSAPSAKPRSAPQPPSRSLRPPPRAAASALPSQRSVSSPPEATKPSRPPPRTPKPPTATSAPRDPLSRRR